MIVYYELAFIINSVVNYLFLASSAHLYNIKVIKLPLVLNILGSNLFLVFLIINRNTSFMQYPMMILMAFMTFNGKTRQKLLATFSYLLMNIFLGGITGVFFIYTNHLLQIILISAFFITIVIEVVFKKNLLNEQKFYYDIVVEFEHKIISVQAFLDTGCKVYTDLSVIFLNEKYYHGGKSIKSINISTFAGSMIIDLYQPKRIMLNPYGYQINAYVAFQKMQFDGLIGLDIIKGCK